MTQHEMTEQERPRTDGWEQDSRCVCGHVLADHDEDTLYCNRASCRCAGHEPVLDALIDADEGDR